MRVLIIKRPIAAVIMCGILCLNTTAGRLVALSFGDIDLLNGQDWSHMAGAAVDSEGVNVRPLGRTIVNQDGSDNQVNPPINTRGPHLAFTGNIRLSATFNNASDGAVLFLYAHPPIIYDEWRAEPPTLRITTLGGSHVQAAVWDGTSDMPVETRTFSAPLTDDPFELTIERHGSWIALALNGRSLGNIRAHRTFSEGTLWFGMDALQHSWTLRALRASRLSLGRLALLGTPPLTVPHDDPSALRSLATKRDAPLTIGAAVAVHPLLTDESYRQLAVGQFSMWTPENDFKPQFVHPQPDVYDFTEGDSIVEAARAHSIAVHGHALVFGEANPRWMQQTPPSERRQVMVDHIRTVVDHYNGRVSEWDVVNEPLSDDPADYQNGNYGLRRHLWFEALGEAYIALAFRTAHEADPQAKLYLNEYGIEHEGQRWSALLALITRLQQANVPIDGVGFQTHVHSADDHVDPAVLRGHIQQLAALGVSSRISELDVHGEDQSLQASEYAQVAAACIAEPTCTSYSTWGITDRYGSTTQSHTYPLALGNDLMWDESDTPKAAYRAVQSELEP